MLKKRKASSVVPLSGTMEDREKLKSWKREKLPPSPAELA